MCIGMGIYILANEEHGHDGEKPVYYFVAHVFWLLVICICCVKIYISVKEFKQFSLSGERFGSSKDVKVLKASLSLILLGMAGVFLLAYP